MEMSANSCWSWESYWKRLWAIKCPSCHRIRPVAQACSRQQWSLKANWKNFAVRDWCAFRIIQRNWQPCVHREWIGKLWNHHATCPEIQQSPVAFCLNFMQSVSEAEVSRLSLCSIYIIWISKLSITTYCYVLIHCKPSSSPSEM